MRKYTVAVVECDTPLSPIVQEHGTYGDIFETFLRDGMSQRSQTGLELTVIKSNVVDGGQFPDLGQLDCVLISGSKHNSFENEPWVLRLLDFVREAYETGRIRLVGICFGHQIIARALGGAVQRSERGWEVSVDRIILSPIGAEVMRTKELKLHQMHRDEVTKVPAGFDVLGSSPVCLIQGMYRPAKVFTTQAHPEFNQFIMSTLLEVRHQQGVFDTELYQSGVERNVQHDGLVVAAAIWRFLLDD